MMTNIFAVKTSSVSTKASRPYRLRLQRMPQPVLLHLLPLRYFFRSCLPRSLDPSQDTLFVRVGDRGSFSVWPPWMKPDVVCAMIWRWAPEATSALRSHLHVVLFPHAARAPGTARRVSPFAFLRHLKAWHLCYAERVHRGLERPHCLPTGMQHFSIRRVLKMHKRPHLESYFPWSQRAST